MQEMSAPSLAERSLRLHIATAPDLQEIAIAVLADEGAHAFEEKRDGLYAYFFESAYQEGAVAEAVARYFPGTTYTTEWIPAQDWNAVWEENFESVLVEDFVEVHPPFRDPTPGIAHHICMMPRMAFGTGHHATTWLMLRQCQTLDFQGKHVLDMGCGTAVLGILAAKLGATHVTAIDIDPWSFENAQENASVNHTPELEIILGDSSALPERCYEIILANINRNVLLADRDVYVRHLTPGGQLLLSGIMEQDLDVVTPHYLAAGLDLMARNSRDGWVMLAFKHLGA
jgi:ribosomal protein L11 methyltransferase